MRQQLLLNIVSILAIAGCTTDVEVPLFAENDDPTADTVDVDGPSNAELSDEVEAPEGIADDDSTDLGVADLPADLPADLAVEVPEDSVLEAEERALQATLAPPLTVFMATPGSGGKDSNDGLTAAHPVATLARVQGILEARKPTGNVEVRIKPGTYVAAPLTWRFYVPGHTVTFLPQGYYYHGYHQPLPVFRDAKCGSTYCGGYWLQASLPRSGADPLYDGGRSGLRFYLLQVEYYSSGGVSINGDSERRYKDYSYNPPLRIQGSKGLNGNTFYGMHFTRIGNHWSGGGYGWGGIVLTNSSSNLITHCTFTNIENNGGPYGYGGYIHGVYITHFSSSNQVSYNRFSYVSSDEVKVRDRSNNNNIEFNTSTHSGVNSHYREEFCDRACALRVGHGQERQCASYQNRFAYNKLDHGYYFGGPIPTWSLNPSGQTNAGGAPCSIPHGAERLHTAGNTGD
jgi:hypothetical protein